ncbi:MAG: hypothetical protein JHD02_04460 [Thermoleophilaceae bacterium]|nr:hypothetical protein [Thermoleophilaceae bacterium]
MLTRLSQSLTALAAICLFAVFVSAGSGAVNPGLLPLYKPVATSVPDRARAVFATFNETTPVVPPLAVQEIAEVDPATGHSLFGMNIALARPTYSSSDGSRKLHQWLIPSADGTVSAVEFDGKSRGPSGVSFAIPIDKPFEKHGSVLYSEGSKKGKTAIHGLVPDSIKTFKSITKRKGKKRLTRTHKIRNNTISIEMNTPDYVVVGNKKTKIVIEPGIPIGEGEFFAEYN